MGLRFSRGLALALLTLPLFSIMAAAQIAVSANDNKAVLVNGVNTVPPNPAEDTATIIDLNVSPPKVIGELKVPNSVVGLIQRSSCPTTGCRSLISRPIRPP